MFLVISLNMKNKRKNLLFFPSFYSVPFKYKLNNKSFKINRPWLIDINNDLG